MAKILVIAKCKDQALWEKGFRSHAEFTVQVFVLDKELAV